MTSGITQGLIFEEFLGGQQKYLKLRKYEIVWNEFQYKFFQNHSILHLRNNLDKIILFSVKTCDPELFTHAVGVRVSENTQFSED